MIIRGTWQRLYHDPTRFATRFVISDATEQWRSVIEAENATYGDLIMLSHLDESREVANSIKTAEFFKYLQLQGQRWEFVTKMDDDSFIDAKAFFDHYLMPRLGRGSSGSTVIARTLGKSEEYPFKYPGGQFYTMTWDAVEVIASAYTRNPQLPDGVADEDVLAGYFLARSGLNITFVDMPNNVAFDYTQGGRNGAQNESTAWARDGADLMAWDHAIGPGSLQPHKMKSDKDYLQVSACFDANGLKTAQQA